AHEDGRLLTQLGVGGGGVHADAVLAGGQIDVGAGRLGRGGALGEAAQPFDGDGRRVGAAAGADLVTFGAGSGRAFVEVGLERATLVVDGTAGAAAPVAAVAGGAQGTGGGRGLYGGAGRRTSGHQQRDPG